MNREVSGRVSLAPKTDHLDFPQWSMTASCLGMSSRVCATGHIKDSMSLTEKSRESCPGGRFPPSFIHQVIIITGLNKLWLAVCSRPDADLILIMILNDLVICLLRN